MASDVNDLTINFKEDNILKVKELDKVILSKGAWATIIFKYHQWDAKNAKYGKVGYSIRRYQKKEGKYNQKSKFNISSNEQAQKIIDALQKWTQEPDE